MSSKKSKGEILLLNGPNLNLLGERNVEIYGTDTLKIIEQRLTKLAASAGFSLWAVQSNSEGELIDAVHAARKRASALIINPGAYSHTSIAIRDALDCFPGPIVEIHLSNIFKREEFRHHSFVSTVATAVICGLGPSGYDTALQAALELLDRKKK
ncbi:MAG: type II 3-dehydroquinate dehydratase [Bdellovibrionota bacterium]